MANLNNFLKEHKTKDGEISTHTRIGDIKSNIFGGSYHIEGNDLNEFHKLYYEEVIKGNKKEYLTEKPKDESLINFDFDFRYEYDINERQHGDDFRAELLTLMINGINQITKDEIDNYELALLEKDTIIKDDKNQKTKDGIHIIINLRANTAEKLEIRDYVIKELKENELYKKLPLINSVEDFVDESVLKPNHPWIMLGSQKPNNIPYKLVEIYKYVIEGEKCFLNPQNINENEITKELFNNWSLNNETHIKIETNVKPIKNQKKTSKSKVQNNNNGNLNIPPYLEKIANLIKVDVIDDKARNLASSFKSIGAKEICKSILKKSSYVKDNYDEWFEDFYENNWLKYCSLGTILHYARQGDIKRYNEIMAEYNLISTEEITKPCDDEDYSNHAQKIFGDDFKVLADSNGNIQVYYYNDIRWVIDNGKIELKKRIMKLLPQYYQIVSSQIAYKLSQIDISEKEQYDKLLKQQEHILKNIKNLRNIPRVKRVYEAFCLNKGKNNNIDWEQGIHQFCFEDRIYDLENDKWIIGNPNDNMRLYSGYKWTEPTDEETKRVNEAIEKIFPIKEERDFYLTNLSTGLSSIAVENFTIANGCGANGKGVLHSFMSSLLGKGTENYSYTIPISVLCSKEIKQGGNPEVANMSYKRFCIASEIDVDKQELNCGIIKSFTSGDQDINCRQLYSNDVLTILRGSLFMECNKRPKWSSSLGIAEGRRLIDVLFRSHFSSEAQEDDWNKLIFQKDNDLKRDFESKENLGYRCALFLILKDYYKIWLNNNKDIKKLAPESISKRTLEYIEDSDPFNSWFKENTEYKEGEYTKLTDMYERFKCDKVYSMPKKIQGNWNTIKNFKKNIEETSIFRKHYKDRVKVQNTNTTKRCVFVNISLIKSLDEESDSEEE